MRKRFLTIALSMVMIFQGMPVYATEINGAKVEVLEENIIDENVASKENIIDENATSGEYTTENNAVSSLDEYAANSNAPSNDSFVSFAELPKDYYEFEYKMWLEELQKELPKEVCAFTAPIEPSGTEMELTQESVNIPVERWNCLQDYDQMLGTYEFVPQFSQEYASRIDTEAVLPVITVHFEIESSEGFTTDLGEQTGIIVPSVDWSAVGELFTYDEESVGAYYNQYDAGIMPPIRNQNPHGTCWAHSANGVIELSMIKQGFRNRNAINYAEWHTAYFVNNRYDDPKDCHDGDYTTGRNQVGGADALTAIRVMALGVGPADENIYPDLSYKYASETATIADEYALGHSDAQVSNYYIINADDSEDVKKAITEYGGVSASYRHDVKYYSSTCNSFYCPDNLDTNHAVVLIGWDDNFPKESFTGDVKPQNDGAWLVRNSWGDNKYSMFGYFWLSYEDVPLHSKGFFIAVNASDDVYNNVYAYDGQCIALYNNDHNISGRNCDSGSTLSESFGVDAGEIVDAVSIEVLSANVKCEATVTDGVNTSTGEIDTTYVGMYTIKLDKPININNKTNVTVSIKLTSNTGATQVRYGYESGLGSQYISSHDSDFKLNGSIQSVDPRIHLYTRNANVVNNKISLTQTSIEDHAGTTHQLSLITDSNVTTSDLIWSSTNESSATVDANGMVTVGNKKGTAVIKGYHESTGQTVTCVVTVKPYKIEYVIDDDVIDFIEDDCRYYYPGDSSSCSLPNTGFTYYSIYKQGYRLSGWYYDSGLTNLATRSNLLTQSGDIKIYPKWEMSSLYIYAYDFNEDLTDYSKNRIYLKTLYVSNMPFNLKNADLMRSFNYSTNLTAYNKVLESEGKEPLTVTYFSRDIEGDDVIDEITVDDFCLKKNDYNNYCTQNSSIYIYPQTKPKPKSNVKPKMDSVSIAASGTLGLYFYIDCNDFSSDELADMYVEIISPIKTTKTFFSSYKPVMEDGKQLYKLYASVPAKNTSDDIIVKIYGADGTPYNWSNAGLQDSTEFVYSVSKAAAALKKVNPDSADFALAMAGYCTKSSEYFGLKGNGFTQEELCDRFGDDTIVNQYIAKRDAITKTAMHKYSFENMGAPQMPAGLNYLGSSLILENTTAIRHYFSVDPGHTINEYKFYFIAGEYNLEVPVEQSGDYYYFEIGGLTSLNYDSMYTFQINSAQYRIKYCVNTYLYKALEKSNNQQLIELAKAMYLFGAESKSYFFR